MAAIRCKFCSWSTSPRFGRNPTESGEDGAFARLRSHIDSEHPAQAEQIERFVQDSGDENDYRGEPA